MNLTRIERTTLPHQLLFQSARRNNRIMGFTLEILRENDKKDRHHSARTWETSYSQDPGLSNWTSINKIDRHNIHFIICPPILQTDALRFQYQMRYVIYFLRKKKGAQRQNTTHLQQMRQTEYVVHTRHKKELTIPYSCKGVWQYGKTNSSFPIGYPSMQGLWSVFTSLSDCTRDERNQRIIKTLDIIGFLLLLRVTGQPRANESTTKRLEFSQSYLIQVRLKDVIQHPNITRKYSRPFGLIFKFNCHYSPRCFLRIIKFLPSKSYLKVNNFLP